MSGNDWWIPYIGFIVPAITGLVVLVKKQGSIDQNTAEINIKMQNLNEQFSGLKEDLKELKSDIKEISRGINKRD